MPIIVLVFLMSLFGQVETGVAAQYSPGLMQQVAVNRGLTPGPCDVAATYAPYGSYVRVGSLVTGRWKMCRVIDYPADKDRLTIINRGIIVELPHELAAELCGEYATWPPEKCPVLILR